MNQLFMNFEPLVTEAHIGGMGGGLHPLSGKPQLRPNVSMCQIAYHGYSVYVMMTDNSFQHSG